MPGHYRSPYGYSYFNPTGKEQAALTIGSLLSGVLAASSGQSKGDAIRKGLAGTMAGYGSGYKNYQELMGDAFTRDLQTKGYGQRIKEYEDTMGLNREKFAEEKRQYEETDKPYKQSIIDMRKNPREGRLPGMGMLNYFEGYSGFQPEQRGTPEYQTAYDDFLAKTSYANIAGRNLDTNNPILIPTRGNRTPQEIQTGGIGEKTLRTLPEGITKSLGTYKELGDTAKEIDGILLDEKGQLKRGDLIGPVEGRTNEWYSKVGNDPDYVKLRSLNGRLLQMAYALSGAQIADYERKWLKEEILPQLNDPDQNYLVKKDEFIKWAASKINTQTETFGKAGYNVTGFGVRPTTTEPSQTINQPQSVQHFISEARKVNPMATEQELVDFYNKKYGNK